jgi:muconolactone delta-isomerase
MPQYLVTMDLVRADPLLPLDRLAGLLREAILPSVESLIDLKSQGTIVTGGYPMGHQSIVFVMQAESEEELYEILKNLPLWTQVEARATPLQRFEELQGPNQSAPP